VRLGRSRPEPFAELVERQLELALADESELVDEAVEAEQAWIRAGRETAEESYGDFQLVVDAIADALLGVRETYARTLDGETVDIYREAFASGVARRFKTYPSVVADLEP